MLKIYTLATLFILILFCSCASQTNRQLIMGSWEIIPAGRILEMQQTAASLGLPVSKVVLTFKSDNTMKSETMHDNKVSATNTGSYSFDENEKNLIIYREGKKDRKNTAGILELTNSRMILVDISGSGDTMKLKKLK